MTEVEQTPSNELIGITSEDTATYTSAVFENLRSTTRLLLSKFPWPTPHAADPSLCSMSFLGTGWHDLICIRSLVFSC